MSNEKILYINYVLCKSADGLYTDYKFKNELNLDDIKQNNGLVTTFYDEKYPFVNVIGTASETGNIITVKDGKFQEITKQEIENNVHTYLQIMINQCHAADYIDTKRDSYDTSILDSLKVIAEKLKITLNPETNFDKNVYFNAYNGLLENISLNTYTGPDDLSKKFRDIRLAAIGLNTFLVSEGTIQLTANDVAYSSNYMIDSYEYEDDNGKLQTQHSFDLRASKNQIQETARTLKDERTKPLKKFKM